MQFWFNKDARLSIPSVSIPYGQRFITIEIESQANLVFAAPGNLFLRTIFERVNTSTGAVGGNIVKDAEDSIQRFVTYAPVLASNSAIDTTQTITNMELYINNIFVNPEV